MIYFLPKITLSFLSSYVITLILNFIFLSERDILKIKQQTTYNNANDYAEKLEKKLFIKYIIFFALGILFLVFFWFLLSSFGAVYQNTQLFLFENTLLSFVINIFYSFLFNFIPCVLRIHSFQRKSEYVYNLSKFIQLL